MGRPYFYLFYYFGAVTVNRTPSILGRFLRQSAVFSQICFPPPPPCHSPVDGTLHKKGMAARGRPTRKGGDNATWRRSGALSGGQRGTCTRRGKPADRPFSAGFCRSVSLPSTRAGLLPDGRR
ncbi:hypothetical protein HMPREF0262_02220 [Clostridium sp. ATCC 29733]|nr:hypothetical protein HMPREF0262_02220 [Clostridium sp. ATCC 29733]